MASQYGIPATLTSSLQPLDAAKMNSFMSYLATLGDPAARDEIKLKVTQELNENLEPIVQSTNFQTFLEYAMKVFMKVLQEGEPHFITEYNMQQVLFIIYAF